MILWDDRARIQISLYEAEFYYSSFDKVKPEPFKQTIIFVQNLMGSFKKDLSFLGTSSRNGWLPDQIKTCYKAKGHSRELTALTTNDRRFALNYGIFYRFYLAPSLKKLKEQYFPYIYKFVQAYDIKKIH